MAIEDYCGLFVLGLDGLLAYGLYRAYKQTAAEAEAIVNSPTYAAGTELRSALDASASKSLPYVTVTGVAKASNDTLLEASRTNSLGLVHHSFVTEHRSRRLEGFWKDESTNIASMKRSCKFGIFPSSTASLSNSSEPLESYFVKIINPLQAEYLLENLPVVYNSFEPANSVGIMEKSFDRIFGEVTKGYQYTEKMLPDGAPIIGIGQVVLTSGANPEMTLGPPLWGQHRFVLTTRSKFDIVDSLKTDAKILRYVYWTLSLGGAALAAYLLYRSYKRNKYRLLRFFERYSSTGPAVVDTGVNPSLSITQPSVQGEQSPCVVCLNAQKDVLLMPCKHLSICSTCYGSLPMPKKCPVCRALIKECLPVYVT